MSQPLELSKTRSISKVVRSHSELADQFESLWWSDPNEGGFVRGRVLASSLLIQRTSRRSFVPSSSDGASDREAFRIHATLLALDAINRVFDELASVFSAASSLACSSTESEKPVFLPDLPVGAADCGEGICVSGFVNLRLTASFSGRT